MWKKALSVLVPCCAVIAVLVAPGAAMGKATGPAIKIGIIGPEGAAVNIPGVRIGAEATVKYANAELKGLAGRKITYVTCKIDETNPATARACANQMVQEKVAAVVHPVTGMGEVTVPIFTGAKIPVICDHCGTNAQLTSPYSFIMSAGDPGWAKALAVQGKKRGFKKVGIVVIDAGNILADYTKSFRKFFNPRGIKVIPIGIKPGQPDASASFAAAAAQKPDAIAFIVSASTCITAVKAMVTAGLNVPRWYGPECTDPVVLKAVGSQAYMGPEAALFDYLDVNSKDPAAKLFRRVMAKYAPGNKEVARQYGYNATLALVRGMAKFKGTVNSASITRTLRKTTIAAPGGHGQTLRCDKKQFEGYANLCQNSYLVTTLKNNKATTYQQVK